MGADAETFDFKAAQKELSDAFPERGDLYFSEEKAKFRKKLFEILDRYAKQTYPEESVGFFETGHPYRDYITDLFEVRNGYCLPKDMSIWLSEDDYRQIYSLVDKEIQNIPKTSKIVIHASLWPPKRENGIEFLLQNHIEPALGNLNKYLYVADTSAKIYKWIKSALTTRAKQVQKNIEEIVNSSKPNFPEVEKC